MLLIHFRKGLKCASSKPENNYFVTQKPESKERGLNKRILCCKYSRSQLNWIRSIICSEWNLKVDSQRRNKHRRWVTGPLLLFRVHFQTIYTGFTHFCREISLVVITRFGRHFLAKIGGRGHKNIFEDRAANSDIFFSFNLWLLIMSVFRNIPMKKQSKSQER